MAEPTKRYVLRDLPGVAELEARLQRIEAHPNPKWAPEADGLDDAVNRLILRLFGIGPEELDDWELDLEDQELDDIFEEVQSEGWDLSDGSGRRLRIADRILLPLTLAIDGDAGHLPDKALDRDLGQDEAASIEARLRHEAARFKPNRKD